MEHWTRHHRALLNALRADELVPKLVARLSLERCAARPDDARLLRDWIASLRRDAGWEVLEPQLDRPRAFPDAWRRAVEAGFSPRTDHHHALLFERFCNDLVAQQDMEVARYAWGECIDAWLRVFASDYVDDLLETLSAKQDHVRQTLLLRLLDTREAELVEAFRLDGARDGDDFDRRRAIFGWEALETLQKKLDESSAEHPALSCLRDQVDQACIRLRNKLVGRFDAMMDAVDLSEDDAEAVVYPFQWIREVCTIVPIDARIAARVVGAAVDIGWKLRKLEVDDADDLMSELLVLASPFNEQLCGFIDSGEAFGHNSTCADFLVFQGEQQSSGARREKHFERALEMCPGHRNASMMLSYEKLREVSDLLLRIRMMPAALKLLPGASDRVGTVFESATELLDDAEALFPSNETIAEYRHEIVAEAERLGTSLEAE
ncbi:hypothetical protein FIV42_02520 [Persicimonas caeni]|uniref:Uncharacterized protein n=1 Tax=Persicimonas caeni TaxID=2292766 RepID=A0A4Y6PN56_PERCE|nr:hypothetical protein [Persicimonas caeni]QDG49653.1 hypothetical protein FIV42_02520 [Persicimonas caeni]QED30874.1 hypothetical protein FRD00_02515 [Persicimonas caeni]